MRTTIGYMLTLAWLCGCATGSGDSSAENEAPASAMPYRLGQALIIGGTRGGEVMDVDGTCSSDVCREIIGRCGENVYADVVLDADGNVLDVLCFKGNAEVREIGLDPVATASAGNDTVLVLDGADDGPDVTGNVVLTGNNAVIYGRGANVSEIAGDLGIDKNNAIVRGVTIRGDVRIEKNNARLAFTEIYGDLYISGNNTTLAECVVHGQVFIDGVNTVLVESRFFSESMLSGKNLECNGNVSVTRADEPDAGAAAPDGGGASSEVETELTCADQKGPPSGRGRP